MTSDGGKGKYIGGIETVPISENLNLVELASKLTQAWLQNPQVRASSADATDFLEKMHARLAGLSGQGEIGSADDGQNSVAGTRSSENSKTEPAVTVRKSLASKNHIISMIDGKPYKSLKRHLGSHGMTPDQYRERFGLKSDYPMVAPGYAEKRRQIAKKIGLGQIGRSAAKKSPAPRSKAAPKSNAVPKAKSSRKAKPRKS